MARLGTRVAERVLARIRDSDYHLTVYYPPAKQLAIASPPGTLPSSPLLPTPNPTRQPQTAPEAGPCLPCLLTELSTMGEARATKLEVTLGGWVKECAALARVGPEAACPDGKTVFDGSVFVEVNGRRYKAVNWALVAPSTSATGTYYVGLTGAGR